MLQDHPCCLSAYADSAYLKLPSVYADLSPLPLNRGCAEVTRDPLKNSMKVVYIKNLSIDQKAEENCPLLGYYATGSGNLPLLTA
jgi:hypothetical protein